MHDLVTPPNPRLQRTPAGGPGILQSTTGSSITDLDSGCSGYVIPKILGNSRLSGASA
jgi:hypothetical protein